MIGDEGTFID